MKYIGLKDLRRSGEKPNMALERAFKILGSNDAEAMAWYETGREIGKSRGIELERLDEWYQQLQIRMFGDDLPEPKPNDIGKIIPPPRFLDSFLRANKNFEKSIENSVLPYFTYFFNTGTSLYYQTLGVLFIDSHMNIDLGIQGPANYPILKLLEEERQTTKKRECKKCPDEKYCITSYSILGSNLLGYFRNANLAQRIEREIIKSIKRNLGVEDSRLLSEEEFKQLEYLTPPFEFIRIYIQENLKNNNFDVGDGFKAFLLSSFLPKIVTNAQLIDYYEFYPVIFNFLGIGQENFYNQYAAAIKRIVFKK